MSTTTIKLFIFFVFIIKIVNCGNCCGNPQVNDGNGNVVFDNPGNENDVDDDEDEESLAGK
ncbi:unnamed protein product [Meloidogyne enterolobii]|uniref:Uncharacterized protein n=2 Tax=Meloidogyne enterolobii TaxID=390850 RepID=A0ACB1AQY3_MELEN